VRGLRVRELGAARSAGRTASPKRSVRAYEFLTE
jgi:hypothetical protein